MSRPERSRVSPDILNPDFSASSRGRCAAFRMWPGLPTRFTGVAIAITVPAQSPAQIWEVVGGTSLACPMFSALWAIANQEAGAPLGQAAQYYIRCPHPR